MALVAGSACAPPPPLASTTCPPSLRCPRGGGQLSWSSASPRQTRPAVSHLRWRRSLSCGGGDGGGGGRGDDGERVLVQMLHEGAAHVVREVGRQQLQLVKLGLAVFKVQARHRRQRHCLLRELRDVVEEGAHLPPRRGFRFGFRVWVGGYGMRYNKTSHASYL